MVLRSADEVQQVVFPESGLTQAECCRQRRIVLSTLYPNGGDGTLFEREVEGAMAQSGAVGGRCLQAAIRSAPVNFRCSMT